jgi:hypothetical protein
MKETKQRRRADQEEHYTAPIRTYRECVAALQLRGESWLTVSTAWHYEHSAFCKLRPLLDAFSGEKELER